MSKPPRSKLRGILSGMIVLGAAAPKPPLAIPPPSKLGGILATLVMEGVVTIGPITVDYDHCVNCKICYNMCPLDIFAWDDKAAVPVVAYPDECYHCGICEIDCPSVCIDIQLPVYARLLSV